MGCGRLDITERRLPPCARVVSGLPRVVRGAPLGHICTTVEQPLHGIQLSACRRNMQWRNPVLPLRIYVSAMRSQELGKLGVSWTYRRVQQSTGASTACVDVLWMFDYLAFHEAMESTKCSIVQGRDRVHPSYQLRIGPQGELNHPGTTVADYRYQTGTRRQHRFFLIFPAPSCVTTRGPSSVRIEIDCKDTCKFLEPKRANRYCKTL